MPEGDRARQATRRVSRRDVTRVQCRLKSICELLQLCEQINLRVETARAGEGSSSVMAKSTATEVAAKALFRFSDLPREALTTEKCPKMLKLLTYEDSRHHTPGRRVLMFAIFFSTCCDAFSCTLVSR